MSLDDEIIGAAARTVRLSVSAQAVAGSATGGAALALVRTDQGAGNHFTNTIPVLGSGSYSFSWANVAQLTGANQSAVDPALQNPVFQATVNAGLQSRATWRVTLTDLVSGLQASTDIDSRLDYTQTAPLFSVTASDVQGSRAGLGSVGTVNSTQGGGNHGTAVVVTNGSGNYSFAWTKVTQVQGGNQTALTPNAQNSTFSGVANDGFDSIAIWRITVSDLSTGQQAHADIQCTLSWFQSNPP